MGRALPVRVIPLTRGVMLMCTPCQGGTASTTLSPMARMVDLEGRATMLTSAAGSEPEVFSRWRSMLDFLVAIQSMQFHVKVYSASEGLYPYICFRYRHAGGARAGAATGLLGAVRAPGACRYFLALRVAGRSTSRCLARNCCR